MRKLPVAALAVVLSLIAIAGIAQSFTTSEKQTISAIKARLTALEASDIAMDARLSALEVEEAFAFSGVTVTLSPPCAAGECFVDISWNVDPPATGQVEWGTTTAYGHTTRMETRLLGFHKQRISGLDPDTTYDFRLVATDGMGTVSYHEVVQSS